MGADNTIVLTTTITVKLYVISDTGYDGMTYYCMGGCWIQLRQSACIKQQTEMNTGKYYTRLKNPSGDTRYQARGNKKQCTLCGEECNSVTCLLWDHSVNNGIN